MELRPTVMVDEELIEEEEAILERNQELLVNLLEELKASLLSTQKKGYIAKITSKLE